MEEKMKEQEPVKENGTEEKIKMSTGRKLVVSLIAVLLVLTAAVYGYGVYYFSGHFLPGTQVNGFNCSYMNQAETEKLLEKKNTGLCSGSTYKRERSGEHVGRGNRSGI